MIKSDFIKQTAAPLKDIITYEKGGLEFSFLATGDIYKISARHINLSKFAAHYAGGGISNIYMRIYENGRICAARPLIGPGSGSAMMVHKNGIAFSGSVKGADYVLKFCLARPDMWFWRVEVSGNAEFDIVYGQDIAVADKNAVLANELFVCQYLDQLAIESEYGWMLACRQNQNHCGHPALLQGALGAKVTSYSTDAMQFFGKSYKLTNVPELLYKDLPNINYQYELTFTALQTEKLKAPYSLAFFARYTADHPDALSKTQDISDIKAAYASVQWDSINADGAALPLRPVIDMQNTYASPGFTEQELAELFPVRKLEERIDGRLLSFFGKNRHTALSAKEELLERPHGHIITSLFKPDELPIGLMTSTNYMHGIFNSQIVCGNTNMNKFLSVTRGLLGIIKHYGQRILIKIDGEYRLLNLPAAYTMGLNFSQWHYKINGDILAVTSYVTARGKCVALDVRSAKGIRYDFIVTNQLAMGPNEQEQTALINNKNGRAVFTVSKGYTKNIYPKLTYTIDAEAADFVMSDDRIFFADGRPRDMSFITLSANASSFRLLFSGSESGTPAKVKARDYLREEADYLKYYRALLNGFGLKGGKRTQAGKLNELAFWYAHNAMVHFAVPHGLEQSGGAAWGTRDVCQGPIEFFLSCGRYDLARKTILSVFGHQLLKSKEWPQWFMFDKYPFHAGDCHGDVVFWPLKAVSDYIRRTGDYAILDEKLPYKNDDLTDSEKYETLAGHIKTAFETIYERFIGGTGLITYAGGDWDDTLQPVNEELKKNLISSWTVALAYQVFTQAAFIFENREPLFSQKLYNTAKLIKKSFEDTLIKDGVIAGFGRVTEKGIGLMLHPDDRITGIHYRLLPMTRSIIAWLVSPLQAELNYMAIKKKLKYPDGIRLMDKPAHYSGGVSKMFMRAEQASNVGREISLQYVHAHIRFIEAMSALGKPDEAWQAVKTINPINIAENVSNALPRQSNTYFSSSDGAFNDRYEYAADFDKLRKGTVNVKSGWRLYSSGPGIFLNQLISSVLGFRPVYGGIEFDPVLPKECNNMVFRFAYKDKKVRIKYIFDKSAEKPENSFWQAAVIGINGKTAPGKRLENPYRAGGIFVADKDLLNDGKQINIEILLK